MPASNLSMKMEEVQEFGSVSARGQKINRRLSNNNLNTTMIMNQITRRSFLESLALGSIYPNVERAAGSQLEAAEGRAHTNDIRWSIAKQSSVAKLNRIDFWSKPLGGITYAGQLPSEIGRGALFYGETTELLANPNLARVGSSDHSSFHCGTGIKSLTELLRSKNCTNKSSLARTTALIALDSQQAQPAGLDWANILPAFRGCYDRLIGHYHINHRGFHHWKKWLKEGRFETSNFERVFTSVASRCDAIIFTCQGLIENDVHLSARASIGSLVGELLRRFSGALLDDDVIHEIVPTGQTNCEPKHIRVYALGSGGATRTYPTIEPADLLRQRELVFSSFGKPVTRPLVIGLGLDEASADSIKNQVSNTNIIYLTSKSTPSERADLGSSEWLKFITLWPFDPDYGPWP